MLANTLKCTTTHIHVLVQTNTHAYTEEEENNIIFRKNSCRQRCGEQNNLESER